MSRRNDRKHAFQLVFQIDFHEEHEMRQSIEIYFDELEDIEVIDRDFIESEVNGVLENKDAIDKLINEYSEGWDIKRLSKADLAIIRLCLYEILFDADIPQSVAINEAVEIAKEYSSDEAPAFVNGVLGKIVANI